MRKGTNRCQANRETLFRAWAVRLHFEQRENHSSEWACLTSIASKIGCGTVLSFVYGQELDHHLGYGPGEEAPEEQGNRRNGKSKKRIRTGSGPVDIEVPRDREGSFEPQLVKKHQRDFDGFDGQILSMYSRGMIARDIRAHLREQYHTDISPELVSRVTESVLEELRAWQSRPLDSVYLVVYLDALKIFESGPFCGALALVARERSFVLTLIAVGLRYSVADALVGGHELSFEVLRVLVQLGPTRFLNAARVHRQFRLLHKFME